MRTVLGVLVLAVAASTLAGCSSDNAPILFPKGPVATDERNILFQAFWIMMIVVIPVFVMAAVFSWRYRAGNARTHYQPNWFSRSVDAVTWIVPALIVIAVAIHVWIFTHELDPYKPLDPNVESLEVQVVAQDWKWLFIYPEQGIATVNELAIPVGKPVTFLITSDTVMNSFAIPALGGQIYAMAGMQTQLNLLADEAATMMGRNMQYSGDGFADQYFTVESLNETDFESWVAKVKQSGTDLDDTVYADLVKPSEAHPITYYSTVRSGLYDSIILKYDCGMLCSADAGTTAGGS